MKSKLFLADVETYDSTEEKPYEYYIIIAAQSYADAMKRIEDGHYPQIEDILTVKLEIMGDENADDISIFFDKNVYKKLRGEIC